MKIEAVVCLSRNYLVMSDRLSQLIESAVELCMTYRENEEVERWNQELQKLLHIGMIPSIWANYSNMPPLKKLGFYDKFANRNWLQITMKVN